MKPMWMRWAVVVLVAATLAATGCARKRATEPPPTTGGETTPVPSPPPPPPSGGDTTTPGGTTTVTSNDFRPAYFDFDSYSLREDARAALDANAKLLRDNPTLTVTIEGHCDERGTVEYNQALGERRAQAARDYLAAAGIASGRMNVLSYGKERPFDPGHDESAWAQNRRAHFTVGS